MNLDWCTLVVPIGIAAYCGLKYRCPMVWRQLVLSVAFCAFMIVLLRAVLLFNLKSDTEYSVEYCVLAVRKTIAAPSVNVPGTGSKGKALKSQASPRSHECEAFGDDAARVSISSLDFESLNWKWDWGMHDGDTAWTRWPGSSETASFLLAKREYFNPLQCTRKIYNLPQLTPGQIMRSGLQWYSTPSSPLEGECILGPHSLSAGGRKEAEVMLKTLNATKGKRQKFLAWIVLLPRQPIEAAELQQAFWKGGNLNEFVLCVGTDRKNNLTWTRAFSWTPERSLVERFERRSSGSEPLDLVKLVAELDQALESSWKVRELSAWPILDIELGNGDLALVCIFSGALGCIFIRVCRDRKERAAPSPPVEDS